MGKISKINPIIGNIEMEISRELKRLRLPNQQLEKVKIYLTTSAHNEISKSPNYLPLESKLYGVKLEERKNLTTLKRPPLVWRNGFYAIS